MSTAVLRLQYRAIQRTVTSLQVMHINWKLLYVCMIAACALMLVWYVFSVNQLTQGSFLIKNYNRDIKALAAQNRDLETSFAQASFWGGIQDKAQALNFEKTTEVSYVKVLTASLAGVQ